jgi:hypothetical protein
MKQRKLNINLVCYAISITIVIIMAALYIAANAILRESDSSYEIPQIHKVNIGFYLSGVEFTYEAQRLIEKGDINIDEVYVVFSKDRNGVINFVGIEGSDKIKVIETRTNRDGSITRIIGLK